jgi:hypothetical protein
VEINGSTSALSNLATGRLQVEMSTRVLGMALDGEQAAAATLVDSLSRIEPAGLTFSPSGLSSGRESRFIADL